jgi:hypothetical protein
MSIGESYGWCKKTPQDKKKKTKKTPIFPDEKEGKRRQKKTKKKDKKGENLSHLDQVLQDRNLKRQPTRGLRRWVCNKVKFAWRRFIEELHRMIKLLFNVLNEPLGTCVAPTGALWVVAVRRRERACVGVVVVVMWRWDQMILSGDDSVR